VAPVRRGQRHTCQTSIYGAEAEQRREDPWSATDHLTPPLRPDDQLTPPPVRTTGDFATLGSCKAPPRAGDRLAPGEMRPRFR